MGTSLEHNYYVNSTINIEIVQIKCHIGLLFFRVPRNELPDRSNVVEFCPYHQAQHMPDSIQKLLTLNFEAMNNNIILSSISTDDLIGLIERAVSNVISSRPTPKEEDEELLTRQEAAAFLSVSLPTLLKVTKAGLPYHRVGNKVRYKKGDLKEYTRQGYY